MRKCWSLTFGVLFFLCLFIGVAIAVDYVIPPPCLIRANNVTVDGTILTGANADYTIKVTNTAGTEYTPVDTAGSSFGSPVAGRFQYLVPKYDGTDQPGGAKTDGKACIELYYKGTKLIMTYPAQGSCPAGSGEVIIQGDGETMGFGGLKGMPDDGAHTFPDPFTVKTPAPNIAMTYDGNAISNGGTIPFGTVLQQTAKTIVLTLHKLQQPRCLAGQMQISSL